MSSNCGPKLSPHHIGFDATFKETLDSFFRLRCFKDRSPFSMIKSLKSQLPSALDCVEMSPDWVWLRLWNKWWLYFYSIHSVNRHSVHFIQESVKSRCIHCILCAGGLPSILFCRLNMGIWQPLDLSGAGLSLWTLPSGVVGLDGVREVVLCLNCHFW